MSVNETIAEQLVNYSKQNPMEFRLKLKDKIILLSDVLVYKSENPVNRPTRRGGVYISDKFSYKIKGTIYDVSLIPLLSDTMLGPNTDFTEIEITTKLPIDGKTKPISILTHLTNSMHNSEKIELGLNIVRFEY